MSFFSYKARDDSGKPVKGVMEARSTAELSKKLTDLGYMITEITEEKGGGPAGATGPASFDTWLQNLQDRMQRVKTDDIIMLNIQLANMITAGLNLMSSLRTLANQTEHPYLKKVIDDIHRNVEMGSSLSDAVAKHPRIFTPLFVSMIRAGEASGTLDVVLNRLAKFAEHDADLQQKVKAAFVYPIILVILGTLVVIFMITFVLPTFVEIFSKANVQMPLPTRVLQWISIVMRKYWYLLIAGTVGVIIGFKAIVKTKVGHYQFDRFKLKIPVVGILIRKICISRFARTLATLVSSGVPILQALEIIENVVGNDVISRVIKDVREGVSKGEKLAEPLKESGEFPPDTIQMIAVGEESGTLDAMLNKVADFYDVSTGYSIRKLTALLEPVFLVIMGSVVGFIVASLLLPMFDMMKTIRR
jgi:type II secretion system protein F